MSTRRENLPSIRRFGWPFVVAVLTVSVAFGAGTYALLPLFHPNSERVERPTAHARIAAGTELISPVDRRIVAPQFKLQTASFGDGSVFDLKEQNGKVVVLFYMAGWCASCLPEARALARLHEDYGSLGVSILAIDIEQREEEVHLARFRSNGGSGKHLWGIDYGWQAVRPYKVQTLDTTIIIDAQGRIAYRDERVTDYDTLAAVVAALIAET